MGYRKDYTGRSYGRLTALRPLPNYKWEFQCICGNKKIIKMGPVVSGSIKSCGCLNDDRRKTGLNSYKHGDTKTRLHRLWRGMKGRCLSPASDGYYLYGGRGIKICKEWRKDYVTFKNWAINAGYKENLTIDRIDVNGDYEPENCKWATRKEQTRNMRTNRLLQFNGKSQCIGAWSEEYNIPPGVLWNRIYKSKWSAEKALTQPIDLRKSNRKHI